jgi:hypothetical protein
MTLAQEVPMLRRTCQPPPIPAPSRSEPSGLLEETTLLVIQHLIARHPDLLAPPEELDPRSAEPALRAAHRVLDALREVAEALDDYRDAITHAGAPNAGARHDQRP